MPLDADAGIRSPQFAIEAELGAVGIDFERPESEPRQLAVDRARGGEPANRNRRGQDLGQGDFPLPACDIEDHTAENAAGSDIERERAGERNAQASEVLELGDDEGELGQVQPGEPDGGAPHLALAVMEQLHLEMGLQVLHLQLHRQMSQHRIFVQIKGEIGIRRRPVEFGHFVVKDEGGIPETHPLQL